ncbi:MAG: hypothetical protein JSR76_06395 [Verrucomicrobia bacterium]|nr:hypothetical protein [Verrucomicrobiota bacterium]
MAIPSVSGPSSPTTPTTPAIQVERSTWQNRAITFVAGSPNASLPRFVIGKVGLVFLSILITLVAVASAPFTKNAFAPVRQAGKAIAKPRNPKLGQKGLESAEIRNRNLIITTERKEQADLRVKFLASMPKPKTKVEAGSRFSSQENAGRLQIMATEQQELARLRVQYATERARITG